MDLEPEFPYPTRKDSEAITDYFAIETEFMANVNFFKTNRTINIRRHAVSIIARHSQADDPDAFIPYLAMNYFDRYVSRNGLERVEGADEIEKTHLVAICCLTLSAKMRTKSFSVVQFLKDKSVKITHQRIMKMELRILDALEWRTRSITAFCFLNHYYPSFKRIGGFKRRCINEIIVQAQGEDNFIHYKPSQIALSAFLAATQIIYPAKFKEVYHSEDLIECWMLMVRLCLKKKIKIEPGASGNASSPRKNVAVPQGQQREGKAGVVVDSCEEDEEDEETALIPRRQNRGKAVVADTSKGGDETHVNEAAEIEADQPRPKIEDNLSKVVVDAIQQGVDVGIRILDRGKALAVTEVAGSTSEIVPIEEIVPKRLMNFYLKWPIDVPSIEVGQLDEPIDSSQSGNIRSPGPVTLQGTGNNGPATNNIFGCSRCSIG